MFGMTSEQITNLFWSDMREMGMIAWRSNPGGCTFILAALAVMLLLPRRR